MLSDKNIERLGKVEENLFFFKIEWRKWYDSINCKR